MLHCLVKKGPAKIFQKILFLEFFLWDAVAAEQVQGKDAHGSKEEKKEMTKKCKKE